jgi:hypothetical protein
MRCECRTNVGNGKRLSECCHHDQDSKEEDESYLHCWVRRCGAKGNVVKTARGSMYLVRPKGGVKRVVSEVE